MLRQKRGAQEKTRKLEYKQDLAIARAIKEDQNNPTFCRYKKKTANAIPKFIAYDFETSSIKPGTPAPLYITAYGDNFSFASAIETTKQQSRMEHLHSILVTSFLVPQHIGIKFVGWNANRFDAYFVAAALVSDKRFVIRPYMTKSKALRGIRVLPSENEESEGWEFLDGIAMLGLAGTSLEKFLKNFAPEFSKYTNIINFEKEEFDSSNAEHRKYAMRDSEGLFHGISNAQSIIYEKFGEPLRATMGAVCIRIFQSYIPENIKVYALDSDDESVIRTFVLRGGYCYCVKRYQGPVWKYDINQAYAAAMRETKLPCGSSFRTRTQPKTECYLVRLSGHISKETIPFYYRSEIRNKIKSEFSGNVINDTWITSIEHKQLINEGWNLHCQEFIAWEESFDMKDYIDALEKIRTTCEGGPSGPVGTMIKAVGNHSFGKTLETIDPLIYILANECPDDYLPFYGDECDPLEHVFYKFDMSQRLKTYHKPQLGAFITAHVRMVLRRAALVNPSAWLYADTDCVVFSEDVGNKLDIDPKRYGAWKVEESGTEFQIITKKVYSSVDRTKRSAKGMNVKRLSDEEFNAWFEGFSPTQLQTQINNFLSVLDGKDMYRAQSRKGTNVKGLM